MLYNGIEAFLEIARSGTFSKAAENLHLTQSTISRRIQLLEEELGSPLIERHKGIRTISITPFGERFINIAERWKTLFQDTHQLKNDNSLSLAIGATDSLTNFTIPPLYSALYNHPGIKLRIRTNHSTELYSLVQKKELDVGFALQEQMISNVTVTPLFQEEMVVIRPYSEKNVKTLILAPDDLDPNKEFYASWSPLYDFWHNRFWDPSCAKRVYIDSLPFLLSLFSQLTDPEYWVILPKSMASTFKSQHPCSIHYLAEEPPERICYKLTHAKPSTEVKRKLELIEEYIITTWLPSINHCIKP